MPDQHLYEERPVCAECGDEGGTVQLTSIAWPGTNPYFLNMGPIDPDKPELGDRYTKVAEAMAGRFVELRLHRECEAAAIARLERQQRR